MKKNKRNRGNEIGELNELKALAASEILIRRNPLIYASSLRSAVAGEGLDGKGTDILIFLSKPFFLAVPIQIKSSMQKLKEHYDNYPDILAIAILPHHTPEMISEKLEKLIMNLLKRAPIILERKLEEFGRNIK